MRIVQILPGSGDRFYCENCVRDDSVVRALRKAGHDVIVAPMYLPVSVEDSGRMFYGGINAYLQQNFGIFRNTPRWLDRLLDSRLLLSLSGRKAGTVRASNLGEMTLSVLQGAEGHHAKELARLLRWLETMDRPDIVHLSSALLLGIGGAIRTRLGLPVACFLQDEDTWIDAMEEPHRRRCWEAMASEARHIDAFIAVSHYYGEVMARRLDIAPDRLHFAYGGVDTSQFEPSSSARPKPPTVGYLSRLCESQGLGVLADAFVRLKGSARFRDARLHLSGGITGDDHSLWAALKKKFADAGVDRDVQLFDFDPPHRREFLASLSVLSVPTPAPVAFGTYVLEALACGVPVVLPRIGSFPELVEATGGGVLYEPNDAVTLARSLEEILGDDDQRARLGKQGRRSVAKDFDLVALAGRMLDVYRSTLAARESVQPRSA